MTISDLKQLFYSQKQYEASHMNELLDFARKLYLNQKLTLTEFRSIVKMLEDEGACCPDIDFDQKAVSI